MENRNISLNIKNYAVSYDLLNEILDKLKIIINAVNSNQKKTTIVNQIKNLINITNQYIIDHKNSNDFFNQPIKYGCKYIGEYKDGKKEGKGIYYYEDGGKYVGDFKNDEFNGKGIYYCNNGNRYEGELKNGKCEGKGILYFKSGSIYDGEFKNDRREGKGIYYYNNGDRYEGDWKNDKKDGKGVIYYNNQDREMGDYLKGKQVGLHALLLANGKVTSKYYL